MGTPRKDPVLVAGGGIGGLAAALALARQGLRVRDRVAQEKLGLFREERSSTPCETR